MESLSLKNASFYALDLEAGIGWNYSRPIYIYRDELGDLFYFKESRKEFYARASASSMGLDFPFLEDYPLIALHYQHSNISAHSQIYKFEARGNDNLVSNRHLQTAKFQSFLINPTNQRFAGNKMMEITAKGFIDKFSASLFFSLSASKSKRYFKISVDSGSKKTNYYRYNFSSNYFVGIHSSAAVMPEPVYALTKNRTQWSITVELEENNLQNSVAILGYQDFKMKMNRSNLINFVESLDHRFAPARGVKVFNTSHLPSEENVSLYYKLYSNMRVHIGVGKFIKTLTKAKLKAIKTRLKDNARELKLGLPRVFYYVFKRGLNQIIANKDSPKKQVKALASLFHYINKQDHSVRLLKAIFGEENIFVFGEILGIYPSYSLTQELEGLPSRTFGAKSWGGHVEVSPIRKLLKNNLVAPLYLHVLSDDISSEIFGELPDTNGFDHF